jgi:DNA-binding NarL/FixJ family response regulator
MKILLTDDHWIMLDAMKSALTAIAPGSEVRTATRLEDAIRLGGAESFDYAILDLGLPGTSGISALTQFREALPDVPVVVFSGTSNRATVLAALDAGAMGFIPKTAPHDVLLSALHLVFSGSIYIPQEVLNGEELPAAPRSEAIEALKLTPRQSEVMHMLLMGLSNKRICRALGITESTVKIHVTAVLRALRATTRTQAVINAARLGIRIAEPATSA